MREKRRDSKGRILRTGKIQRPDRRYVYKYSDYINANDEPQFVYNWRLAPANRLS